jgi:DNA-binding MarR family transcriptional regulator
MKLTRRSSADRETAMPRDVVAQPAMSPSAHKKSSLQGISELISYRISVLNRAFEQEAGRTVARQHGLSLTEVRVLGILNELSPTTVKHLSHVMRLKRPQVSRALALLHEQDLVEAWQNPADGRSTNYAITKKGRQRAREVLSVASVYHHDRLGVLTAEERVALDSALDKLMRRASESNRDL